MFLGRSNDTTLETSMLPLPLHIQSYTMDSSKAGNMDFLGGGVVFKYGFSQFCEVLPFYWLMPLLATERRLITGG